MSFDPSKWSLGSFEIFAALLPGGITLYALRSFAISAGVLGASWPAETLDWAVFLVGSLVLGYLAHPPAHILNKVYNSTYLRWRRNAGDPLLDYAKRAAGSDLGPKDSVYAWAKSEVEAKSTEIAARVDRIQGISKMFRTLTLLSIIASLAGLFFREWALSAGLAGLAVLSFLVFSERRFAATKEVYQGLKRLGARSDAGPRIIRP